MATPPEQKVQILHLPNHTTFGISPVFSGLFFKNNDLSSHAAAFPAGFTIVLHSEDDNEEEVPVYDNEEKPTYVRKTVHHVHRYKKPTVRNDSLFISSISQPNSNEWKPPSSQSRMVAMMLWTALLWYFQQAEPDLKDPSPSSANTPLAGQPEGEWRVKIKKEGIFRSKRLLSKFERMGLIMTQDSCVGVNRDPRSSEGWLEFFCTRRAFWQLDARIFLFSLSPSMHSPFPSRPGSPSNVESTPTSRTGTPAPDAEKKAPVSTLDKVAALTSVDKATLPALEKVAITAEGLWSPQAAAPPPGPFDSPSHLPTFFPPHPLQFTFTNGIRHPMRPKPPLQGEVFYDRFVPSIGSYLSFRSASLSSRPVPYLHNGNHRYSTPLIYQGMTDVELIHKWMNNPRVSEFWGEQGPKSHQQQFLETGLSSKHSFPVIANWDDKPFGYFEIYWVKEDNFGRHLEHVDNWDRGFHVLVGEEDFRGSNRLRAWISALVHFCFLSDNRTQNVYLEPRVDNVRFIKFLQDYGFHKVKEVALPHKQAAVMRIVREAWEGPVC